MDYYNFFNIFFKNKLYIFTKLQKQLMKKYSFNSFIMRYTDDVVLQISNDTSTLKHELHITKFQFKQKVIYFKKLNFLKLDNYFFYLLY